MKGIIALFVLSGILATSCKTGSKTTVKSIMTTQHNIMPADSFIQKQKMGIDFYASGNQPAGWSLELDFDKLLSFKSSDGTTISLLPNFDKRQTSLNGETYRLQTDAGPMTIMIMYESCADDDKLNRRVQINLQNKSYSGCGKYLFDHQLNDIWVLESIGNIIQSAKDFAKGLPTLELNLQTNKMTGTDGCNNISSTIEVQGNRIRFSPFTSTKVFCNNNKAEKIFSGMISDKLVDYYMENNKLVFYLQDDSKISFKRKSF